MKDYGTPDLYRSPRYSNAVTEALTKSATSSMWDDWDLEGLLVDTPHKFSARLGVKHGIFCSTGTAGLHASLMALPLRPGDEVIAPCMTFIRAVTPLVHLGLIPVLADIDHRTGNLDPASLESVITSKTRVVIVVHMWGIAADMEAIKGICRRNSLLLIEDFSHAHLSKHEHGFVGSFGDIAFASLQRKKTLSVGEGGIVVTNDVSTYDRLRQITSPGSFKGTPTHNEFSGFGLNLRMSPFSGVVARQIFSEADSIVSNRATHGREFDAILAGFPDYIAPPHIPAYVTFVSPYGYKPTVSAKVSKENLSKANTSGLWQFSSFSYGHLLRDVFWKKDSTYYPFSQMIQPKALATYPGYDAYIKGRVGLSVPTTDADYWTDSTRSNWRDALATAFDA